MKSVMKKRIDFKAIEIMKNEKDPIEIKSQLYDLYGPVVYGKKGKYSYSFYDIQNFDNADKGDNHFLRWLRKTIIDKYNLEARKRTCGSYWKAGDFFFIECEKSYIFVRVEEEIPSSGIWVFWFKKEYFTFIDQNNYNFYEELTEVI
jgi:hypothetical protein